MLKQINRFLDRFKLDKPCALQWHEWEEWEKAMRTERPFSYWLNETVPDFFKDIRKAIKRPINDARYAIRVRVFDRYHVINTGLKPGYHDCDERLLHGMFNLLVDFVEVEKAWMHVAFDKDERKRRKHPWWSLGWTRFKAFRDPQAGLDHLKWEATLDDPKLPINERSIDQAAAAREVMELYHWWKEIRPWRPDPMDASGWSDYCEQRSKSGRHLLNMRHDDQEEAQLTHDILDLNRKIEEEQHQEDEEMLIRLIKIRRNLWT